MISTINGRYEFSITVDLNHMTRTCGSKGEARDNNYMLITGSTVAMRQSLHANVTISRPRGTSHPQRDQISRPSYKNCRILQELSGLNLE